jgi:diguanylate cyclase
LREHLEQVRRDSLTDALTNVANRKAFDEALHRCCAEADTTGIPLSLAVVDVDHFKKFNDTWGHQTGDQVLRYVASVLARLGAAPRLTARYGGEEFAIIFPGETADVAARALDRVRREIASRALKRRSTNEDLGSVTVSMGVAQRLAGEKAAGFIERADAALYQSKHNGRNRLSVATDGTTAAAA